MAAAYFCWFSAINLMLISVFWTLMADIFSPGQATRLFAFIAAGGSLGAIMGPLITTSFVKIDGDGWAAVGGYCGVSGGDPAAASADAGKASCMSAD